MCGQPGSSPEGAAADPPEPVCCRPFGAFSKLRASFPGAYAPGFMLPPLRGWQNPLPLLLPRADISRQDRPPFAVGGAHLERREDDRPAGIPDQDRRDRPAAGPLRTVLAHGAVRALPLVLDLVAVAGVAHAGGEDDAQHAAPRRQVGRNVASLEPRREVSARRAAAGRDQLLGGEGRLPRLALEAGAVLG